MRLVVSHTSVVCVLTMSPEWALHSDPRPVQGETFLLFMPDKLNFGGVFWVLVA